MPEQLYVAGNHEAEQGCGFESLPPQIWPDQWHASTEFSTPQSVPDDEFSEVVDGGLSFTPSRQSYRLGNPNLPVAPYREHIVDTILNHQNIILASPTGTGKSSQTGLYLLEDGSGHGVNRIFISSPRILAARQLMGWARQGLDQEYEELAGYLTGTASDSDTTDNTRLFYVTEQLLFKMANRGMIGGGDVVINDEAHERGVATIYLQGLTRELMQEHPDLKLVISSATMDTLKNARHFKDTGTNEPAAVIELKGVTHPITDLVSDRKVAHVAKEYMQEHNVLVFEPGETRQLATRAQMTDYKNGHTVHILNATLSPSEQAAALNPADKNHIVGNKIAETSITPDNKDVVVDSGLSNIGRYEQGVKVLKTVHSSKDTMMQRRGRIGRTGPGTYIMAEPENAPPIKYEDRDEYGPSPIETSSVASYIAELLITGRRTEHMDLLERPTGENLSHDYKLLSRLGATALVDGNLVLTEIGRAMADLPLDITYARMLVEARTIDSMYEVDRDMIRSQVAAATSVRQVSGILNSWNYSRQRYRQTQGQQEGLSYENTSDLLFELDVFIKMFDKHQELKSHDGDDWQERFEMYLRSKDVFVNRYYKAFQTYEEICRREGLDMASIRSPKGEERLAIIGCQIAGAEELFVQKNKYIHKDIRGGERRLGKRSTIDPTHAELVVGSAFDFVGLRDTGHFKRSFIVGASAVRSRMIERHAPQRLSRKHLGYAITSNGDVVQRQTQYFDNYLAIGETTTAPEATIETREFIVRAMMKGFARKADKQGKLSAYDPGTTRAAEAREQWQRAQDLEHKSGAGLGTNKRYEQLIAKTVRESIEAVPLEIVDPKIIDQIIPSVDYVSLLRPSQRHSIADIEQNAPGTIEVFQDEERVVNLPVTYKHNVAYLAIPYELQYKVSPESLTTITDNHQLKISVGGSDFVFVETAFKQIEKRRNAYKRQKRLERRAEAAMKVSTPEGHHQAQQRLQRGTEIKRGKAVVVSKVSEADRPHVERKKQRGKWRSFRAKRVKNTQSEAVKS